MGAEICLRKDKRDSLAGREVGEFFTGATCRQEAGKCFLKEGTSYFWAGTP